ncbi:hypothetical protein POJ06DRAFT_214320 [Lipomyces tetrasporus]|uniref:Nucleolar protein Dnt1-like N-terminal domain-containing protein n=1 Tax=Lipomyces tetrasporus TaxID=54092 RepID=A0AAD7QMC3_9ASCO|nr:uncharacterized protein POJ06DRAFT_214320 [Lipomyces tetrasporus]KAJ8097843.1 hypothetical protein POJ06DRAFT_214320 [Lipomyces tetrasporus]
MSVAQIADQQFLRLQINVLRTRRVLATYGQRQNTAAAATVQSRLREEDGADPLAGAYELVRKFVHLTHPLISIALLRDEIAERHRRIYGEPLEITSVKDESNCDFDLGYLASYVFTNGSIVNVIIPPTGGPEPSDLDGDGSEDALQEESFQQDALPVLNKGSERVHNWLSNAASKMTETAKRSLKSSKSEELSDEDISETPSKMPSPPRERSPSLTPDDSSSYIRTETSARPTKRRRHTREPSPEIPESVVEESQAADIPTQVDEFNQLDGTSIGKDDSFTGADRGLKLLDRRRSFRSDIQLNPRLSLPPVLSSDADVDVDPQKQPSSGHATASSSPVRSLFDIPIIHDNASTTSVSETVPNGDRDEVDRTEEEVTQTKKVKITTEVAPDDEIIFEELATKETTPSPAPNSRNGEVRPTEPSGMKIIHQLKGADGEVSKPESIEIPNKSRRGVATRAQAKSGKAAPRRTRVTRNLLKTEIDDAEAPEKSAMMTAGAPIVGELVHDNSKVSSAPEQPAPEVGTAVESELADEVLNESAKSNRPATVRDQTTEFPEVEVEKKKAAAMLSSMAEDLFKANMLQLAQSKLAQEKARPRLPSPMAVGAPAPLPAISQRKPARGRPRGSKTKPKVPLIAHEDSAMAETQMPTNSRKQAVPLPPTVQEGFGGRAEASGTKSSTTPRKRDVTLPVGRRTILLRSSPPVSKTRILPGKATRGSDL